MTEREKAIRLAKAYFGVTEEPGPRYIDWPENYRGGLMMLKVGDAVWRGTWNPYLNIEHAKMLQELLVLKGCTIEIQVQKGAATAGDLFAGGAFAKTEAAAISDMALCIADGGVEISVDILAEMLTSLKSRL